MNSLEPIVISCWVRSEKSSLQIIVLSLKHLNSLQMSFLSLLVGTYFSSPCDLSITSLSIHSHSIFQLSVDMKKLIVELSDSDLQLWVLSEKSAFIVLCDDIQLIEADKLTVTFLDVVFKMMALIFQNFDLFEQMGELCVIGWALFFPDGDVDLVFSLVVGMYLDVLVHAVRVAAISLIWHFEYNRSNI